ncbi:MAG: hypothetical protein ACM3PZ_00925 [Bacillota bacterium]
MKANLFSLILLIFLCFACAKDDDNPQPINPPTEEQGPTVTIRFAPDENEYLYLDPRICIYLNLSSYSQCHVSPKVLPDLFNSKYMLDKNADNVYQLPSWSVGDTLTWGFDASAYYKKAPELSEYYELGGSIPIKKGDNLIVIKLKIFNGGWK